MGRGGDGHRSGARGARRRRVRRWAAERDRRERPGARRSGTRRARVGGGAGRGLAGSLRGARPGPQGQRFGADAGQPRRCGPVKPRRQRGDRVGARRVRRAGGPPRADRRVACPALQRWRRPRGGDRAQGACCRARAPRDGPGRRHRRPGRHRIGLRERVQPGRWVRGRQGRGRCRSRHRGARGVGAVGPVGGGDLSGRWRGRSRPVRAGGWPDGAARGPRVGRRSRHRRGAGGLQATLAGERRSKCFDSAGIPPPSQCSSD